MPARIPAALAKLPQLSGRTCDPVQYTFHETASETPRSPSFLTLRGKVALHDPTAPRLTIELECLPRYPIAMRFARQLLRQIAPSAVKEWRDAGGANQPVDRRLLGYPVGIRRVDERMAGESHSILLHIPELNAPLLAREGVVNEDEVTAVVEF